jgi:hypothetical protein
LLGHFSQEGSTITWRKLGAFFLCRSKKIEDKNNCRYYSMVNLPHLSRLMDFKQKAVKEYGNRVETADHVLHGLLMGSHTNDTTIKKGKDNFETRQIYGKD